MYQLQPYDQFSIEVFTGNGERIIDPDFELTQEMGLNIQQQFRPNPIYEIQADSTARLPMVGSIQLAGYTQQEAELAIQEAYTNFYSDVYATLTLTSQRVILLGAVQASVVPLPFEGMTVMEVLAMAGGLTPISRAQNIRVIRGPFDNPQVSILNLNTIAGLAEANVYVQPGDIIYVEPRPQSFQNGLRDIAPVLNLVTSGVSLTVLVLTLVNNSNGGN
ncbi:MAG TPA: polysaccharide export protein EpsE [Cytophagales bacterium]|nr:polysaccharide export protein EpsE [Cytophagales bacterium]HAA19133.1 polysaccharide export protein EpsE [Cytophagales bacterium]HAP62708.1 polysaccharide export protein EpsE [Cytophagales bacterium]